MRIVPFIISTAVTAGLVFALNKKWGTIPPMGKFLSPQHGFWQNAEPTDNDFNAELKFPGLKGRAEVYFDERLIPHVFAENDEDLYFIQGYLHAKFRLFQMDLQTKAASGRASEMAGPGAINYDKGKRRLGMVFAAENALKEAEKDPITKAAFESYADGVNAYISSLTESSLPLEYKLLDLKPEKWSDFRTVLLLKMMAENLSSGSEDDLESTNAKSIFTAEQFNMLYPQVQDSLIPIIPKGTLFDSAGIVPVAPATADSLYFNSKNAVITPPVETPDENNGSNNWVVAGSKTQSGMPILCNDPHLELSLPSIWYEMQLQTPNSNAYGVSLPGSPFIIIGFNDSIAWGVTNSQRDVKDYYEIKFRDDSKKEYWFNGAWTPTELRTEEIKVKGGKTVYDTVAYTVFGPVMYDQSFSDTISKQQNLAVRWVAHDAGNEALTFYKLNRAKNYADYEDALKVYGCPGQNFVFASKSGDIAIWQQGKFPARWKGQGLYVMPGEDSSYMWQGFIPQSENPHSLNPERGYLESANQRPVDSTYPYFIPGTYITPRAITIDNRLAAMYNITVPDMMKLQTDYFNSTAEDVRTIFLQYVKEDSLSGDEKKYLDIIKDWDLTASPDSKGQTVYARWWYILRKEIFDDEFAQSGLSMKRPGEQTVLELLKKDSAVQFVDNINTPQRETLNDVVTLSLKKAVKYFNEVKKITNEEVPAEWYKANPAGIYHLMDKSKKALLPFARRDLHVGGNYDIINATNGSHGPSWRMIVQLSATTEAYGVYPAGQSGNPGSKYYDDFVDTWAKGEYYPLWMMKKSEAADKRVKWIMKFSN